MTDREILDLLLEKVSCTEEKVSGIENKVSGIENEVSGIKDKVSGLENEVSEIKDKVTGLEKDAWEFKLQIMKSTAELKGMDTMILDEVERVHEILDKHKEDKEVHIA